MATKLSTSDLAAILTTLKGLTESYQLGIQLGIDIAELDTIEKNHPTDIGRQKTEVIKYWLRNSPDASWITLAKAVDGMGGHANLVGRLREKEQSSGKLDVVPLQRPRQRSSSISMERCIRRNILILGKMGHGKSTLGNRILENDGSFRVNDQQHPKTSKGSTVFRSKSQLKNYKVRVYDHDGLFEGDSSINIFSSDIPPYLNLVLFLLKCEHSFDAIEREILKDVVSEWQISGISALVLTHCERLSKEEREKMIKQFKNDHPSIADLMGKGILAVGFPDNSHVQRELELRQSVEDDETELKQLIYSCEERVTTNLRDKRSSQLIPQRQPPLRCPCSIL